MKAFDTIRIANCHASLLSANAMVERFCKHYGVGPEIQHKLLLLLEEALVNVINHGFDDDETHMMELSLYNKPPHAVMRLRDDGKPFDPRQQPSPPLGLPAGEAPVGGLGIYLMQQLADTICYQRSGKYNILTLYCIRETKAPSSSGSE